MVGTGDYSYDWNGTASRNDLTEGQYTVEVTDNQTGCTATVQFALAANVPNAQVTADDLQINCFGGTPAKASYSVQPGTGFVGTPRVEVVDVNGNVVDENALPAGNYCVMVYDGNNCLAGQDCFEVSEPAPLNISFNTFPETCDNMGSIEVIVTGGTAPFGFDWSDLQGSNDPQNRTNLRASLYDLQVTDANGCFAQVTGITVANTCLPSACDSVEISNVAINHSSCGNQDGSIEITMNMDLSDFDFNWAPNVSTSNVAQNLQEGIYYVTISRVSDPIVILIPALLSIIWMDLKQPSFQLVLQLVCCQMEPLS
ncbi:MAG: SprB repeat-containing protein [Saprospiraceae bacterium]